MSDEKVTFTTVVPETKTIFVADIPFGIITEAVAYEYITTESGDVLLTEQG